MENLHALQDSTIDTTNEATLSIGDLATRTGLSVLRIRAWEARHCIPVAVQSGPGGHRRYTLNEAMRLEMISQAIDLGWRIGNLKGMTLTELQELLNTKQKNPGATFENPERNALLAWTRAGDERSIRKALLDKSKGNWKTELEERWIPWMRWIGEAWESGELTIAEEHFVSAILQAHLEWHWRQKNATLKGYPVVLTLLDGDRHSLGLHLCAIAATEASVPVLWLGGYTPMASVLSAAREWNARGICISVSISCDWALALSQIKFLQEQKPSTLQIVVGGQGYKQSVSGVVSFPTIGELYDFLKS